MLTKTESNDKNLIKSISTKIISVTTYPMNVTKLEPMN